jgi:hypothetical protein
VDVVGLTLSFRRSHGIISAVAVSEHQHDDQLMAAMLWLFLVEPRESDSNLRSLISLRVAYDRMEQNIYAVQYFSAR